MDYPVDLVERVRTFTRYYSQANLIDAQSWIRDKREEFPDASTDFDIVREDNLFKITLKVYEVAPRPGFEGG